MLAKLAAIRRPLLEKSSLRQAIEQLPAFISTNKQNSANAKARCRTCGGTTTLF